MSDPPFHRIAIVGLGLIGGSIAFAARKAWPSVHVVGIDRQPILDEAIARRAIHDAGKDPAAVAGADLVVLAAPVLQNLALLKEVVPHAAGAVITDVGSTKRGIVSAAESLGDEVTFVGRTPAGRRRPRGLRVRDRGDLHAPSLDSHARTGPRRPTRRRGCSRSRAGSAPCRAR